MPKIFPIVFGISNLLLGLTKATGSGPYLISFLLGWIIAGVLFGLIFGWIWTKIKNKFVRTVLVIFCILLVGQKLEKVQSFTKKACFKSACSKKLRSKQNEAYAFLNAIFLDLRSSFQDAKKVDLKQAIDGVGERLNKEDATTLTYFEELEKLAELQQKVDVWINDFDKKDVEAFYNLLEHIILTLKTEYKDSPELLEDIRAMELANNFYKDFVYSKENLEILKEFMDLGVEKFFKQAMEKYSTPEGKKRLLKALSYSKSTVSLLENMVNTPLFVLFAEDVLKGIMQILQFADKKELGFDLEKYMEIKFTPLKESLEGQRKIIEDIEELLHKCELLLQAAIEEFCFS